MGVDRVFTPEKAFASICEAIAVPVPKLPGCFRLAFDLVSIIRGYRNKFSVGETNREQIASVAQR